MTSLLRLKLSLNRSLFRLPNLSAFHQFNFYSTQSADDAQEPASPTQSRPLTSSRTNKQSIGSTIFPKPKEIPYQSKVANYVNLVGYVEAPVHSETDSDGKHFSAIVISQRGSDKNNSLSIPVVFDGDLAYVVAYHVKPKDRVLVSGRLSEEPLKFSMGDRFGKFHVVGEDVNFVEGFGRNVPSKKVEVSFSGLEKVELYENVDSNIGNVLESKQKGLYKNNNDEEWWNDLVKNPHQWWDYRSHKSNGLVKENFPDFKHKTSGSPLWINSAPRWVSTGLGRLEFDVKAMQGKQVQGGRGFSDRKMGGGKREDLWKDLVENPNGWWDNRLNKWKPKAPDFTHKETREGVWLNELPDWVLSRLPPSRDSQAKPRAFEAS